MGYLGDPTDLEATKYACVLLVVNRYGAGNLREKGLGNFLRPILAGWTKKQITVAQYFRVRILLF